MIGYNKLTLNSTMVQKALEYYFENVLFQEEQSPTITSITYDATSYTFSISTCTKVKENS